MAVFQTMEPATPRKTFCVDLDGTLCTNTWGDYDSAQPLPWAIARVNALARAGHRIVILTARGTATGVDWREHTEAQLAKWDVSYHELVFGKPEADIYVDDRTIHTEAWRSGDAVAVPARSREVTSAAAALLPRNATVIEVGRSFGGELFRPDRHAEELLAAAAGLGIPAAHTAPEIGEAVAQAAEASRELLAGGDDLVFTLALSGPPHAAYVDTTEGAPSSALTIGWRPLSQAAAGLRPFLAEAEGKRLAVAAATRGGTSPGMWPLALDPQGGLEDPMGGELVLARDGRLHVRDAARGVAATFALELAERLGLAIERGEITLAEAREADEIALVGMPFCVLPIARLDGDPVGKGPPGPLARELLAAWSRTVGFDVASQTRTLAGR